MQNENLRRSTNLFRLLRLFVTELCLYIQLILILLKKSIQIGQWHRKILEIQGRENYRPFTYKKVRLQKKGSKMHFNKDSAI